jgi:hypothetical protein
MIDLEPLALALSLSALSAACSTARSGDHDAARDVRDVIADDAAGDDTRAGPDVLRDLLETSIRDVSTDSPFDASDLDASDTGERSLTLAIIGDYGVCGAYTADGSPTEYVVSCPQSHDVARLVHSWNPDAILTTGDNSYGSGAAHQIPGDQADYDDYIHAGTFFPVWGNHDWYSTLAPSFRYFGIRDAYYVHRFGTLLSAYMLDTNHAETATGTMGTWFVAQRAASTTAWNIAFNHQAPYSSCGEYSTPGLRWIAIDGIDAVFSGHSHVYERLLEPNATGSAMVPHVVIGASGAPLQGNCGTRLPGQQSAVYRVFGAVRMDVTAHMLRAAFIGTDGVERDSLTLVR